MLSTGAAGIEQELAKLLTEQIEAWAVSGHQTPIAGATDLTRDLGLESIQIMEFVVEVEDHYDISIPLESLSKARTIGDLAAIVARETGVGR